MRMEQDGSKAARADRRLMALNVEDGAAGFTVTFSPGIERFIGRYPRVEGLCAAGRLLSFAPHAG